VASGIINDVDGGSVVFFSIILVLLLGYSVVEVQISSHRLNTSVRKASLSE